MTRHPARVVEIVRRAGLRAAQLHGHEHPGSTRDVRSQVPFVIKAFVAGSRELDQADEHGADAIMLDSAQPGSGQVFDWRMADGVPNDARVIIAGGLTPENVADAVQASAPVGRRRVEWRRARARPEGPRQGQGLHRGGPRRRARRGARSSTSRSTTGRRSDVSLMAEPTADGRFGEFGGRFVPETLVPACQELDTAFREAWADPTFPRRARRVAAELRRAAVRRSPNAGTSVRRSACACC